MMTSTPLPRLGTPKSATDMVFDTLYQAVISLQLPPGTRVSEAEVAQQLDVSRQPVRDAFFRLSNLGFLAIRPQRATLITPISPTAIRNALFVRVAIECECLQAAAQRMDPSGADRLRALLSAQQEAADPTAFYQLDEAFHREIAEIAGHGHAWDLITEQKAHMDRVRLLTLSSARQHQAQAEHVALAEALIAGDLTTAQSRLRAHLNDILNALDKARADHPEYFDPA
ncbi:GntR family transcriptional regulator [Sagittula sp. SSi028]|uniref:GntR family transcriptional regulator n=1 Tax=Sagittula sp. SSi028 TaxID=3400636 RepID=UPI003AF6F531